MPNYSIKNLKTFRGMEGQGFNLTLYRDGIKVATVDDDANGGCFHFHWFDRNEESILKKHCESLPNCGPFEIMDAFVDELVNDALLSKKMLSSLKKKTLFVMNELLYTVNAPYTPELGVRLQARYLLTPITILNSLPTDEAYRLFNKYGVK
jgi:hypothetical protein